MDFKEIKQSKVVGMNPYFIRLVSLSRAQAESNKYPELQRRWHLRGKETDPRMLVNLDFLLPAYSAGRQQTPTVQANYLYC